MSQEPLATQQLPTAFPLKTIMARKLGMTQFFDVEGLARGVTEFKAGPVWVVAVKTRDKDGYDALSLGFDPTTEARVSKAEAGIFKKAGIPFCSVIREVRMEDTQGFALGQEISIRDMFKPGDYIDILGVSKGHGFAGAVKRWSFRGGPATHGQSDRHRAPGSLAGRRSLGRVLPGKKMAGHWGVENTVVAKMEVIHVDPDQHKILINGGAPGSKGSLCVIRETLHRLKHRRARVVVAPAKSARKKEARPVAPAKK